MTRSTFPRRRPRRWPRMHRTHSAGRARATPKKSWRHAADMPRGCMARRGGPCTRPGVSAQPDPGLRGPRAVPPRHVTGPLQRAVCTDTPGAWRPCCGSRAVCPGCGRCAPSPAAKGLTIGRWPGGASSAGISIWSAVTRARSPILGFSSYDRLTGVVHAQADDLRAAVEDASGDSVAVWRCHTARHQLVSAVWLAVRKPPGLAARSRSRTRA